MTRNLLSALAGALAGFWVCAALYPKAIGPLRCDVDAAELQVIVREALAAPGVAPASVPARAAPPRPASAVHERTEDQRSALEAHAALLRDAERRGTWTAQDSRAIRGLLPRMNIADRTAAMAAVAAGINAGRLKLLSQSAF